MVPKCMRILWLFEMKYKPRAFGMFVCFFMTCYYSIGVRLLYVTYQYVDCGKMRLLFIVAFQKLCSLLHALLSKESSRKHVRNN